MARTSRPEEAYVHLPQLYTLGCDFKSGEGSGVLMRSKFQRRHYEAIAAILRAASVRQTHLETVAFAAGHDYCLRMITADLVDLFQDDNGMFKRERFIAACKV